VIELNIEIKETKLRIENNYNFNRPILVYLVERDHQFLTTFVILDFVKGIIKYIKTYSEENIKKIEALGDIQFIHNPSHSSLCFDPDEGFFNFLSVIPSKNQNTFRYIDLKQKKMKVYCGEDLGFKNGRVSESSTTTDLNYFVLSLDKQEGDKTVYHIKCSKDMRDISYFSKTEDIKYPPHTVHYHDNKIFTTEFNDRKFTTRDGVQLKDDKELEDYFYNKYKGPSDKVMDSLFSNMVGINVGHCELRMIDENSSKSFKLDTMVSHIEHDRENDIFYICSNNFVTLREYSKIIYLGPVSIYKFRYDGDLHLESKFQDETAYRFTAHKFRKPHVCGFGYPNRLFVINSDTMKVKNKFDIWKDILSGHDNIKDFLNNDISSNNDPHKISTFELSEDSRYLFFIDQVNFNIIDITTGEIIDKQAVDIDHNFIQKTNHSETL